MSLNKQRATDFLCDLTILAESRLTINGTHLWYKVLLRDIPKSESGTGLTSFPGLFALV